MGLYTAFAEVSASIVSLLRDTVSPEPLTKPEQIGICSPKERGNYTVGVFLYHIEMEKTMQLQGRIQLDTEQYKEPPLAFSLYYMIFVHLDADMNTKCVDEQRILGKIIQQLYNYRKIPQNYLRGSLKAEQLSLEYINISLEDKNKLYSLLNHSYETACFYKISPVLLDTEMVYRTKPVKEAQFQLHVK